MYNIISKKGVFFGMIEIYIFVNPIDYTKRDSLMNLFKLIQKSSQNIKFQIVPLATMPLMDQYFNAHLIPRSNLEKRNFLFNKAHQIALYYETLVNI